MVTCLIKNAGFSSNSGVSSIALGLNEKQPSTGHITKLTIYSSDLLCPCCCQLEKTTEHLSDISAC